MQAIGASAIPFAAQNVKAPVTRPSTSPKEQGMELGAFSISLTVKDLETSRSSTRSSVSRPSSGIPPRTGWFWRTAITSSESSRHVRKERPYLQPWLGQ